MNLDQWVQGVKDCPEGEVVDRSCPSRMTSLLDANFSIGDNWDIFLNGNLEKITADLINSGKFSTYKIRTKWQEFLGAPQGIWAGNLGWRIKKINKFVVQHITGEANQTYNHMLFYTPGTVLLQAQNHPAHGGSKKYNLTFKFHPYQESLKGGGIKMPGVSDPKAMAFAILDVINYLRNNSLEFCIPCHYGNNNIDWENYRLEDIPKPIFWPNRGGTK